MPQSFPTPTNPATEATTACVAVRPHLLRYIAWRERLPDLTTPVLVPGWGLVPAVLDGFLVSLHEYKRAGARPCVDAFGARLYYRISPKGRPHRAEHRGPQLSFFDADPAAVALDAEAHEALRERRFITDAGAARFNRIVEQMLVDDLSRHILQAKAEHGTQEKDAIEDFLDLVGIADCYEFDRAKKSAWRLRVHTNAELLRGNRPRPRSISIDYQTRARVRW
jgi:hypothetical protein